MKLTAWATRHHITPAALAELRLLLIGAPDPIVTPTSNNQSEAAVQTEVRLEASRRGYRLWRNNVGAGMLENGSFVRFGLANDSAALNAVCKSSDLIGIRPVRIGMEHIGQVIGRFVAREIKHAGWRYSGTEREVAQLRFIEIITGMGGDAAFCTGVEGL